MELPVKKPKTLENRGGQGGFSYPWNTWLKLGSRKTKEVVLELGKDFNCLPHSMAQQVRNAVYRRNLKCSIQIYEDGLVVTVSKPTKGKSNGKGRGQGKNT